MKSLVTKITLFIMSNCYYVDITNWSSLTYTFESFLQFMLSIRVPFPQCGCLLGYMYLKSEQQYVLPKCSDMEAPSRVSTCTTGSLQCLRLYVSLHGSITKLWQVPLIFWLGSNFGSGLVNVRVPKTLLFPRWHLSSGGRYSKKCSLVSRIVYVWYNADSRET